MAISNDGPYRFGTATIRRCASRSRLQAGARARPWFPGTVRRIGGSREEEHGNASG